MGGLRNAHAPPFRSARPGVQVLALSAASNRRRARLTSQSVNGVQHADGPEYLLGLFDTVLWAGLET